MQTVAPVNIYLDDCRETPKGFIRTYTVEETLECIEENNGNIGILSLDNDLGEGIPEGRKVLDWIDEQVHTNQYFVLPKKIVVHSSNGPAGEYMRKLINRLYA